MLGDVALDEERADVGIEPAGDQERGQVERRLAQLVGLLGHRDRVQVDERWNVHLVLLRPPSGGWRRRSCRGASRPSAGSRRTRTSRIIPHYTDRALVSPARLDAVLVALEAGPPPAQWPSEERAEAARALAVVPPLVFAGEARQLQASSPRRPQGARSSSRPASAPSRSTTSAVHIREKLKIMLQMAAVLTYGATLRW